MVGLILLVTTILVLHHWLIEPFVHLLTPVLTLSWLGWAALAFALWLFAGPRRSA
jgi:hypothetical protein